MTSKRKSAKAEKKGVYVYLGPSIRGVIQNGSIYCGTRTQILETLKTAVESHPMIERLIVEDVDIMAAKEKINKGDNLLSIAYKRLLAE